MTDYDPNQTRRTKTVADEIAAERRRQVRDEGWTASHDDEHTEGSLARAAACYALAGVLSWNWSNDFKARWWPWDETWWKPSSDRRRNLVKAGALIIAEIERLDRTRAALATPHTGKE